MSNIKGKSFPTPKNIPAFPKMSKKRKYHFLESNTIYLKEDFYWTAAAISASDISH